MQYSIVALAALVASAVATPQYGYGSGNYSVAYTTEVYTAYTTVCPASTEISFNGITYTATESTTLTITNCPCTVVKPVTTSSVVAPVSTPVYYNTTVVAATTTPAVVGHTTTPVVVGTTSHYATASPSSTLISANSGNKAITFSGASLAGLFGLVAYAL